MCRNEFVLKNTISTNFWPNIIHLTIDQYILESPNVGGDFQLRIDKGLVRQQEGTMSGSQKIFVVTETKIEMF